MKPKIPVIPVIPMNDRFPLRLEAHSQPPPCPGTEPPGRIPAPAPAKAAGIALRVGIAAAQLLLWSAWVPPAGAEFAAAGHGMRTVLQGSVPGGALFLETHPAWTNVAIPSKPYVVETSFRLPPCDSIEVSRLLLTVWGGTAQYTARLGIEWNGVGLPGAAPLVFGSTNDANAVFRTDAPSVYGSGSGVWLLGIPVPPDGIRRDGTPNVVRLTLETPDGFDGRVNHVTLLAVHRSPGLTNFLDYVVAEGSGDVYRAPTGAQTDTRTVRWTGAEPAGVAAARFQVLYTYGDVAQNDRLYFNGVALGGDDVANYDKTITGLDFGPVLADFDVSGQYGPVNEATVSVAAADVPGTRETSLRPQWMVLQASRRPVPSPLPALDIGLGLILSWPHTSARSQLEYRPDAESGAWTVVSNEPVVIGGRSTVILPPGAPRGFYQLRALP